MQMEVHNDHDAMCRSGLAEKSTMKKARNQWGNGLGKFVAAAFKDHNYGKKYEELKVQAELMGIEFLDPKSDSETKFTNSYSNFFNTGLSLWE